MQLTLERQIATGFIAALGVILLIGLASWWSLVRFERAFGSVAHTHQVLNTLEQILVQALNVQTGSRGYALSGDLRFLEPYEAGVATIQENLATARELTAADARMQSWLDELESQIVRLLRLTHERNELVRQGAAGPALELEPLLEGKRNVDAIRQMIHRMESHERELLEARTGLLGRRSAFTRAALLLTIAAFLAFAAYAGTRIQRDFAARQRADLALQRSRALFETLFEQATDALLLANPAGTVRRVNRRAEDLFGYNRAEIVGRPLEDLMPERYRSRHVAHRDGFNAVPKFRAMGAGLELFGRKKDGTEFPVDIMLSPLELEDGPAVLGAVRDITERKAAALALQQHSAELETANRELEAFSYSVSHDLRAPLRHLAGFATMLEQHLDGHLDELGRRYLSTINGAARKMGQLIDDLLAFSRLGRTPIRRTTVATETVVRALVADNLLEADPATEWHIEPLPPVEADLGLLRQVWQNLLGNAAKYSRQSRPPVIHVRAITTPGETVFSIQDNGVGFDTRYADKLFQVFSRLHSDSEFPGTGIGLALVHRIVTRHGGRVWAESQPGAGATFHFTLPR